MWSDYNWKTNQIMLSFCFVFFSLSWIILKIISSCISLLKFWIKIDRKSNKRNEKSLARTPVPCIGKKSWQIIAKCLICSLKPPPPNRKNKRIRQFKHPPSNKKKRKKDVGLRNIGRGHAGFANLRFRPRQDMMIRIYKKGAINVKSWVLFTSHFLPWRLVKMVDWKTLILGKMVRSWAPHTHTTHSQPYNALDGGSHMLLSLIIPCRSTNSLLVFNSFVFILPIGPHPVHRKLPPPPPPSN